MTLGIHLNNPFNLRYLPINRWLGLCGSEKGFCRFDTSEHGLRAGLITLRTYVNKHGLKTPRQIVNRFAPQSENNVDSYLLYCCNGDRPQFDKPFPTTIYFLMFIQNMLRYESRYYVSLSTLLNLKNKYRIEYNF